MRFIGLPACIRIAASACVLAAPGLAGCAAPRAGADLAAFARGASQPIRAADEVTKEPAERALDGEPVGIVAEVNGVPITYEDVEVALALDPEWLTLLRAGRAAAAEKRGMFEQRVLERMIDDLVMSQEAEARGLALTPEEEREVEGAYKKWVQAAWESEDNLKAYLERRGIPTRRPFERFRRSSLIRKILRYELAKVDSFVRPADIRRYYEKNAEEFRRPGRVVIHHIWVSHRRGEDEARRVIEACKAAIDGGSDWDEVCRAHSDGPESDKGGRLEWARIEDATRALRDAIERLEPGQTSDIIEVPARPGPPGQPPRPGAFALVRLDERSAAGLQPLSEVEEAIRERLEELRQEEVVEELREQLRDRATVRIR